MNNLVIMKDRQAVTTSLQIAEAFEKQHKDVLEAINNKIQSAENSAYYNSMFAEGIYLDSRNRNQKMYYMNRDGFTFIAMGFTGRKADEFKFKYIDAFNDMERQIINGNQYQVPTNPMSALKLMFEATKETKEDIQEVKNRVVNLEENGSLNPGEYNYVSKRVSQRIFQIGRDRSYNMNKKQKAELYKALNSEIASITGIKTRSQLKIKHFDMVIDFIDDWEPSKATSVVVKQLELEGI